MIDYSENLFHLNEYCFLKKELQLAEIKNKFFEINLFYKYLGRKDKIRVNKRKILIKLQKLRNK